MRISGYDEVRSGGDGAFQDTIVLGIVTDGANSLAGLDEIGQFLDFTDQGMNNALRILELSSAQDSSDLIQDGVRDRDLDPAFDGQFQDLPRLPPEDDG